MKVLPIRYTENLEAQLRFLGVLGLHPNTTSRAGGWADLRASGGMVGVHVSSSTERARSAGECELAFEADPDDRLEDVLARLHAAGYPDAHIIDEAFGRSLRVTDPDGVAVQVNESDPQLYA